MVLNCLGLIYSSPLPIISCVALGRLCNLSVSLCSHLCNRTISAYLIELLGELAELILIKHLQTIVNLHHREQNVTARDSLDKSREHGHRTHSRKLNKKLDNGANCLRPSPVIS